VERGNRGAVSLTAALMMTSSAAPDKGTNLLRVAERFLWLTESRAVDRMPPYEEEPERRDGRDRVIPNR
jgi:hypothetical protein